MRIDFTEEQAMLLETAADFCRNHSPMDKVRSSLDAQQIDASTWQEMVELGWLGINVPAEYGGLDLGLHSVVPIVESMGRHLMGSPYTSTVITIETLVRSASAAQKTQWLPRLVAGSIATMALTEEDGNWRLDEVSATGEQQGEVLILSGQKCFVTDADCAALIVASIKVAGTPRLVLITADQIPEGALSRETVIDQTRRSFSLSLEGIEIPLDQLLPASDFTTIELASVLMLCAEISGGLTGVLHTIIEYLNMRKAFDRFIGSYQALKHPTVDILLGLEAAKSHLYHAATMLASDHQRDAEIALRIAKSQGSETFAFAGDRAIQFHGGFGFTFECDAQLYLRRALWCQYQFGDDAHHRQLLAPLLLDEY